jgi:hypothetical protein
MYNFAWNRSHVGRAKIKPVTLAFGDGAATIAYSYDGIYWNSCRTDAITTRANHGCWNGYIWVAVGTGGNWVATSYDGLTWTGQDYSIFNEGYYVAWNGTMFVAAGTGENTLATSTDGFNWSAVSNSVFSTSANYVEWTGNVWCAVGSGTNTSATSTDGTTWTATAQQFMVTDVSSVIWDITSTTTASSGNAAAAFDGKTAAITTSPTEWRSDTASYNSDGTASSLYSTALDTGSTIYGEYLTITPAESTILNYYVLHFSISGDLYEIPSAWYVLGAATTSPTTWSVIDQFTFTKTAPPTYGSRGYYACPVAVSTTTAAATYRIVFTNTFAAAAAAAAATSHVRVMEADFFYASATTTTIDRKIRPFLTPNGVMYPIRLGSYNYLVYTDRTNTLVKTNTFGLSYYNCDISGLDIYANSGLTRGFAYDGQNCVAISSGGKMSYTPDFGKTWSDIVSPTYANTDLYAIAHNGTFFIMGGNQYVAVATNGNSLSYVSSYSLSTLSATTVDSSSISLSWGGDSTSVQLIWNLTGGSTYSTATDSNQTYGNTVTATTINGLYSNARYYFKITPVSDYGEYGTAIYDISSVTLASLTTFATATIYDTSAQIYVDGSYSYIDISYGRAAAARYYKTGYIDISNITPNTYYTAAPTIYNLAGVSTTLDEKSVTFITNPKISLSSTTIDVSTVFISTTNDTAQYSTATLWWNTTGTFSTATDSSYSYTNNYYLSGLSYNTSYYFRAEPIGATGSTGVNAYTNVTTAAILTTFNLLIYDTSAQIVYDGSFTYLDISYAAAAAAAAATATTRRYYLAPSTTKLDISNLTPDTSYVFSSAIYNRASSLYAGQNVFAYTLPKVAQITAAVDQYKTSSTYITLTFAGNYTSLNLWWNLSGGTYAATDASATGVTGTTYTIYDLSQNTTYYIRTIPVGSQGAYGYARDISVNTSFGISFVFLNAFYGAAAGSYPMYLTYSTATAYDISTISLNWGGYYDNVIVQYDTSSGFVSPITQTYFDVGSTTITGLDYNTTYYFKTTPSALGSGNTGNTITTNATTNATLTSYELYIYDTSAQIVYDGSLTYIDISYVGSGTSTTTRRYYGAPGQTTDISNLIPDTSYVFSSVYYGRAGANFAGQTISAYSLPKVATFAATETAFTAAKLSWSGGKYTAMNLYWDTSATYSTIEATVYGNTYTAANLTADTVYYFRAQPVGAAGATGYILDISLNLYSVYLTSLTAATYDSSSIYVYYVGSFDTLTTVYDTSSVATAAATTTTVSRGTEQSLLSSLSPNTIYYFRSTPATTSGAEGTAFTATATTAPTLTRFEISIYDTSAQIVVDGSLSYIDISYVAGDGTTAAIEARYYDTPTTISITDLTPDTSYVFQSVIYNKSSASFAGTNTTQYTLPKVAAFSGAGASFTSAQLTWSGGKYTAMNLYWDTSAAYSAVAATVYGNTYTATELTTNTIYYFRAQPVGAAGASGYALDISINIYSVYFTAFDAAALDSSCITLTFAGIYDTGSIVRDISSGFSTTPVYTTVSSTDTTSAATNLAANTKYYFAATPQTSSGIAGTVFYADATTAATLTQFYIFAIYDTSAQIVYDGSLSYVDISAAGSIVRSTAAAPATYTIENISPNTYYSVYLTYYNSAAAAAAAEEPAQFITLPRASDLGAAQYDLSAATISWSTYSTEYTAVNLYWGTAEGATDISSLYVVGGNTYVAPNLATNTTYYFTLEPIGAAGATGTTSAVQIYIYNAALTAFTATAAASSSTINLAWTGDYDTVDISAAAATTTYDTSSARIENLSPNTTYYFTATPYTPARISGAATTTVAATTAAKLTQYYISAIWDTSAQIVYDGSLSYVDISAAGQTAATNITSGIYDLSALTPDTYYKIQIIYYNSAGAFDTSAATILTLPRATDLAATQTGLYTADVTWSGNYTTANLYWGTTAAATDSSAIGITGGTYTISFTLTQDTMYYFTLEPVGAEGAIGATLTTETYMYDDTLVTFTATARDSSSIELAWTGNYDQLDISYNNTIDSYYDPSINSALIENLAANTTYYFAATPYTPLDLAGTTLTVHTTTAATLTQFYVAATYDTSAQIVYDGSLSYVDISAGGATARAEGATAPTTYTIENLTPNTYYKIEIIYYNIADVSRSDVDAIEIYTNPRITDFSAVQYDSSSAVLAWGGGNYTTTNVYWGAAENARDISSLEITENNIIISNLTEGTTYYFTIEPIGAQNATGIALETSLYIETVNLTDFYLAAVDSSSIVLTWEGSYNSVQIVQDTSADFTVAPATTSYSSSTATAENLAANTTYYYSATPYATGGIFSGSSLYANTTTAARLTGFYVSATYDTSAQLYYDGSFAYVDISSNNINMRISTVPPQTYSIENLTPNTYYTASIAYYNSAGDYADTEKITFITRPRADWVTGSQYDLSAASLTWDGYYTTANVYWGTTDSARDVSSLAISGNTFISGVLTAGTTYYFTFEPVGVAGAVGDVLQTTVYIEPAELRTFLASQYDSSSVVLVWDGSYNSVQIVQDTSADFTVAPTTTTYSTSTATVENLAANTTYYYAATPYTSSGIDGTALYSDATTDATLTRFYTISVYDTSAQILFDGSLSFVDISAQVYEP